MVLTHLCPLHGLVQEIEARSEARSRDQFRPICAPLAATPFEQAMFASRGRWVSTSGPLEIDSAPPVMVHIAALTHAVVTGSEVVSAEAARQQTSHLSCLPSALGKGQIIPDATNQDGCLWGLLAPERRGSNQATTDLDGRR